MVLLKQFKHLHFTATYRPGDLAPAKRQAIASTGATPLGVNLQNRADLLRLLACSTRLIWMAPPDANAKADHTLRKSMLWLAARAKAWGKPCPSVTYVSTTGVYGNALGDWIDERTPVNAQSERAKRRVHAEQQVKTALRLGMRVQVLRAPGIYGDSRLPTERLKAGTPALLPEEDSWSNHIHELDLARLSVWSNFKSKGWLVVNACDAQPQKMGDYFDAVAKATGLPKPPRLPRKEVKALVSPMMWSFMAESRRIRSRQQARLGFKLAYPSVEAFLGKHFV